MVGAKYLNSATCSMSAILLYLAHLCALEESCFSAKTTFLIYEAIGECKSQTMS